MDADFISYETMLAAQEASRWAFWSMIAAVFTAAATCLAVLVAIRALSSWKSQLRSQEMKDFSLSVYNFHMAFIRVPELVKGKDLDDFEFGQKMLCYDALAMVYQTSMLMHDMKLRGEASIIFNELNAIFDEYLDCETEKKETADKILKLRTTNTLLTSSF